MPIVMLFMTSPRWVGSPPAGLAAAPGVHLDERGLQVGAGRTVTVEEADTTFRVYGGDQLLTEVLRTSTSKHSAPWLRGAGAAPVTGP